MTLINMTDDRVIKPEIAVSFDTALCNLILEMQQDGYTCCAPSKEVADLDAALLTRICRRCGKVTQHFEPFTKYNDFGQRLSYRPFTICETCGKVVEF